MDDCISLDPNSGFYPNALILLSKMQKIPVMGQFELTARCNFNCKMCYIHMSDQRIQALGKELTAKEWLRIAEEAKEEGMLYLSLTGGEIFTRPDFRELYEELSEMGFLIQLMTNASMIDENVMNWLSEKPPYSVRITLYGSDDGVYRAVCGIDGGFQRVNHAIELLQEARIPVSLKSILIRDNERDLRNMLRYAAEHGLNLEHTYGVTKSVRGAVSSAASVRRLKQDSGASSTKSLKLPKRDDGHGPYRHNKKYLYDCGAYGSTLNVTWDGHLGLCSFMAEPYVDLRVTSVAEAWKSLLEKVEEIRKPDACNTCKYEEYCTRCPGVLAAESGSYLQVTEEYCEQAKFLFGLYNPE